jgi:hypothetical protein
VDPAVLFARLDIYASFLLSSCYLIIAAIYYHLAISRESFTAA